MMPDGTEKTGTIDATLGRLLFNEIIPQDLGFVDREVEETSCFSRLISMSERNS